MDYGLFTDQVEEDNFTATYNYLALFFSPKRAAHEVELLRKEGAVVGHRVNDVVRSAGGVPWSWDDPGVKRELMKSLSGKKLHPPILVNRPEGLVIADGSHRVSFAYHVDPFMTIPVYVVQ